MLLIKHSGLERKWGFWNDWYVVYIVQAIFSSWNYLKDFFKIFFKYQTLFINRFLLINNLPYRHICTDHLKYAAKTANQIKIQIYMLTASAFIISSFLIRLCTRTKLTNMFHCPITSSQQSLVTICLYSVIQPWKERLSVTGLNES